MRRLANSPAQVKILHESEESGKVDKDGKPRSKGLGFIEFTCVPGWCSGTWRSLALCSLASCAPLCAFRAHTVPAAAFLPCSKHDHAVACLRQLNNNPSAFTNERRPIVEFAIDNVKVRGWRGGRATHANASCAPRSRLRLAAAALRLAHARPPSLPPRC